MLEASRKLAAVELSIVIPVLNDVGPLQQLLDQLRPLLSDTVEIIVVDGGSVDGSAEISRRSGVQSLRSPSGRGLQLNTGCQAASGDWIWMLHADSVISDQAIADQMIADQMIRRICALPAPGWGRFDLAFQPAGSGMKLISALMNLRASLTGICTGDQGIFVHRRLLAAAGGVPEQPLMEDIELSRRLKPLCHPRCLGPGIVTSARRWHRYGPVRTVLAMWWFRLRYWWGVDPEILAAEYYG